MLLFECVNNTEHSKYCVVFTVMTHTHSKYGVIGGHAEVPTLQACIARMNTTNCVVNIEV